MDDSGNKQSTLPPQIVLTNPVLRWLMIVLGWSLVMLGVIGIFIPGLPTTVFIIMAVWAFSRSSEKFHHWLWFHPRMGPSVRNWYTYRVIPIRAKKLAIATMALSVAIVTFFYQDNLIIPVIMTSGLVPIGLYICTRASKPGI